MNKFRTACVTSAAALLLALSPAAQATLIIDGDFSATFPGGSAVTSLSSTFQASFDDSVLTGVGSENFNNLAILTAFTLSPNPLGVTTFDTSNVGLNLSFSNGTLFSMQIGGLPNGVGGVSSNTDDFFVGIGNVSGGGFALTARYSVATEASIITATSQQANVTVASAVPEPASAALVAVALVGMVGARRRSKRQQA
jgi:hypothetical protein